MLERFRPHENERGLTFGLTWSAVGCALALIGLTSCGYIIPEDTRAPRYNSVIGERRTPMLNNQVGENMPAPDTGAYPSMTGAPVPPEAPMANAPSDTPPPSSADYAGPTASVQAPNGAMPSAGTGGRPQRSFWDKTRGWVFGDDAEINGTPIPLGTPLPPGAMNDIPGAAPDADTLDLAMGSSSEYPKLEDVQDVPPASVEARDRLQQAQEALVIDKARAAAERDAAAREAASEPTLLEQYKQGKLPPAPQAQPLQPGEDITVNLPSSAPVAASMPAVNALPEPDMVIDLSSPSAPEDMQAAPEMVEAPPPPPTVNVVRGVQSEIVEIREPAEDAASKGYLPTSRYEMRATTN